MEFIDGGSLTDVIEFNMNNGVKMNEKQISHVSKQVKNLFKFFNLNLNYTKKNHRF